MTEGNTRSEAAAALHGSWRASELIRRPVVDVRLGLNLGEVGDIVFDPARRRVSGLLVQSRGRESAVLQVARRAFGGNSGLTYLDVERIISLHADVVTLQDEPEAETDGRSVASAPMPRLSAFLGFAVISVQGRRLGRFADLLLGPDGRTVVGYLMRPPEGAAGDVGDVGAAASGAPPQQVSQPYQTSDGAAGTEAPPQDSVASLAAALLVVQADEDVRFGRDVIVVARRHDTAQRERSLAEAASARGASGDIAETPTWQHWESEAPTEQVRH